MAPVEIVWCYPLTEDQFKNLIDTHTYVPSSDQAALCWIAPSGTAGATMEQSHEMRQSMLQGG